MSDEASVAEMELKEFFRLFEKDAVVKLFDVAKLSEALGKAIIKIGELRKSRDSWREKYLSVRQKAESHASAKAI